jgi:predicted Zn-dependent protease
MKCNISRRRNVFINCRYGLIGLVLLTGCAQPVTQVPGVSAVELQQEVITQKQLIAERQIDRNQQAMKERLLQQERLMRVSAAISRAGLGLCARVAASEGHCAYEFELLPSGEKYGINAFTDGKVINVSPSMMRFAATDDMLALVLSHELSHAMLGHVQAKEKGKVTGALVGAVLDSIMVSQGLKSNREFEKAGGEVGALAYSKEYEREADYVGMYIMALAGYDIRIAADFWRKMSVKQDDMAALSITHPSNPERTVMLVKTAAEITAKQQRKQLLVPEWKAASGAVTEVANPYIMHRR